MKIECLNEWKEYGLNILVRTVYSTGNKSGILMLKQLFGDNYLTFLTYIFTSGSITRSLKTLVWRNTRFCHCRVILF